MPRQSRPGRRSFGANAEGRLGLSPAPGEPRPELDLPRRVVPRGHLQDDEHGVEWHAHAVVPRRALTPEQRWAITDFIGSLSGSNGPGYTNLVVAKHVQERIDLAKGAASFASAPVARFPIVGQIMEPGRAFHPPATSVTVQAIYDADSIALLVRWHDMSAQKTGTNGPSLPVPPEEEEEPAAGEGASAGSKGSVFGEAEVAPTPAGKAQDPFAEAEAARRQAIRVLRRGRGPDSFAGADGRPQALLHLR